MSGTDPERDVHATVEQVVRAKLAEALGGRRGVVETAVPTIVFTVSWILLSDLRLSLVLAGSATAALLLVRIVQRSTPQFCLNALVGIGIAALFAARSGDARDVFLPGILYNGGYAVVLVLSILVGWPLMGVMIAGLLGETTSEWRRDPGFVSLCNRLTWVLAAPCILRVLVQYPLWAADRVGWLGATKLALGWPLQLASFAFMAWLLSRDRTPADSDT